MKKILLVVFTSVVFVFNGLGQCSVPLTPVNSYGYSLGPGDTVYCYNEPVLYPLGFNLTGGSNNYTYEWYSTPDVNVSYIDLKTSPATWTLINGATSATYTPPAITQSIRFKRVTTDVSCPTLTRTDYSYVVHLYKVDVIEAQQKTCSPSVEPAKIIDLTSDPLWKNTAGWYQIQWESSTTETGTYTNISGATNFNYIPVIQSTTVFYRRRYQAGSYAGGNCAVQYTNAVAINPVSCLVFSSSISGATTVTPNQAVTYSVPEQLGMLYQWTVTNGTITGGQGTYSITVVWDDGSAAANFSLTGYSVAVTETNDIQMSKSTTQSISMTTTGINKGFSSTGISVYPNPVKNQFAIEMPTANTNVNYVVYSTSGIQMQSGSFTSAISGNIISTQLPLGMYQLVLNYDGVFTSTKLAVIE